MGKIIAIVEFYIEICCFTMVFSKLTNRSEGLIRKAFHSCDSVAE